jgi:serine/threonine protein kinase
MSEVNCIAHTGWGVKLGSVFKTWRRRWFVLQGSQLNYYVEPGGKLKGTIDISNAVVYIDETCKRQPAFAIKTVERICQVNVDSLPEAERWLHRIRNQVHLVHQKVSLSQFTVNKVIGRGGYGKVCLVTYQPTGEVYAMKSLSKAKLAEHNLVDRTLAERDVLINVNHPFLVSAKFSFTTESKVVMVMDYVPGGEIFQRLRVERRFAEDRVKLYTAELILAIEYLHALGVVHRDLKPENILIDREGHLKITDYGLVKLHMTNDSKTRTFCGTPDYMAPEIIVNEGYGLMVDWWSIGILTFEMLYGGPPFQDQNTAKLYQLILNSEIRFPTLYPVANQFIAALCKKKPEERLGFRSIDDIKSHAWFAGTDWTAIKELRVPTPWKPPIRDNLDVGQFDSEFTQEPNVLTFEDGRDVATEINDSLRGFSAQNTGDMPDLF